MFWIKSLLGALWAVFEYFFTKLTINLILFNESKFVRTKMLDMVVNETISRLMLRTKPKEKKSWRSVDSFGTPYEKK